MKNKFSVTLIILAMFIITQFIGLYVVNHYSTIKIVDGKKLNVTAPSLPLGLETPEIEKESDFYYIFSSILVAFVVAILILFFLTKFKVGIIIKIWFLVVVTIALIVSLNAIFPSFKYSIIVISVIALGLALLRTFRRGFLVHNLTELFIYPGIAAIFVPILNFWTVLIILVLISIYDIWAVWHSGVMQKMAKFQINEVKVFSGFFVPHITRKFLEQMRNSKKLSKTKQLKKKIKVNIGILGGGDVFFPLVTAGVMLKTFGVLSSVFVIFGAALGLGFLLFYSKKKKYYPAMPFITGGIFIALALFWFLRLFSL